MKRISETQFVLGAGDGCFDLENYDLIFVGTIMVTIVNYNRTMFEVKELTTLLGYKYLKPLEGSTLEVDLLNEGLVPKTFKHEEFMCYPIEKCRLPFEHEYIFYENNCKL